MPINPDLLKILVCPACKQPVREEGQFIVCTNQNCSLEYPIKDGIPVMLIDEARRK